MKLRLWRKSKHVQRARVAGRNGWSVETWFYEQENGLTVISETRDAADGFVATTESLIPKKAVLAYARKVAPATSEEA